MQIGGVEVRVSGEPGEIVDEQAPILVLDHARALESGLMGPDAKAMQIVGWLKKDFGLGHGHAMAIWCAFQKNGWTA